MRQSSRPPRRLPVLLAVGGLSVAGFTAAAVGSVISGPHARPPTAPVVRIAPLRRSASAPTSVAPTTTTPTTSPTEPTTTTPTAPAPASATGNARLDALLPTLPAVLSEGGAHVHYGFNPIDCCHAGGYNPGPNDVWVSERTLASDARLVYVTVHELGHSLHLHSARGAALTAAVAGAPVVRPGSPSDASEKVADCVAWVLYPTETAASGLTYWTCPEPWRSRMSIALG